jgi:hypothetical protein
MAAGETVAVDMVALIVKRSCDKLSEHYAQQCAMRNTARLAVEAVMQAIEVGTETGKQRKRRDALRRGTGKEKRKQQPNGGCQSRLLIAV